MQESEMNHKDLLLQAGFNLSGEESKNLQITRQAWSSQGMRAQATMISDEQWEATAGGKRAVGATSCEALYKALELRYNISTWQKK
jgi:hypothetical protein